MRNIKKGFTLIELLIVVAIIAILAAIAVPNFLEAQVRAKISRCQADMRTLATALTTYKVDTNKWIHDAHYLSTVADPAVTTRGMNDAIVWAALTTPIAYISTIPIDGFQGATKAADGAGAGARTDLSSDLYYFYYGDGWLGAVAEIHDIKGDDVLGEWLMASPGPDKSWSYGEWNIAKYVNFERMYDSSNGTVSYGDVIRIGP